MNELDYTNLIKHQAADSFFKWHCPKGHEQKDYTPVPDLPYCAVCRVEYQWSEIEKHGALMTAEWLL